jgi:hypothetical protein
MIAEESAHSIKKTFDKEIKRIEELKKRAQEAKGDIEKTLSCYKEAKSILVDLKSKVEKMDVKAFDKAISGAATILSIVTGVGAAVGLSILLKKFTGFRHIWGSTMAGTVVSLGTLGVTQPLRDKKKTKKNVLNEIDDEIKKVDVCIEVLSNPSKYGKYLKGIELNDNTLSEASFNQWADNAKPIINKLLSSLNQKIKPLVNEEGIPGMFVFEKYVKNRLTYVSL